MMNFDRKYKLTVGKPGQDGIILSDLQFTFTATKTVSKEPNKLEGNIYNLSPESRKFFVRDSAIKLEVAYGTDDFATVFLGTLVNIKTTLEAPDTITHFDAGDAYTALRDSKSTKSFAANSTVASVARALVADMGLVVGTFDNGALGVSAGLNRPFKKGYSVIGSSKSALDSLIYSNGLIYMIQDGVITIVPAGGASLEGILLIDQTTGMIGSPELVEIDGTQPKPPKLSKEERDAAKERKRTVERERVNGIQFTTLMNPELRLSRRVKVESKFLNHVATIQKVIHKGDFRGDTWTTECEGLI